MSIPKMIENLGVFQGDRPDFSTGTSDIVKDKARTEGEKDGAKAMPKKTNFSNISGIFPKEFRLRSKADFRSLKANSRRIVGKTLCIDYRPSSSSRLGITASGRYGSSCERNRFKRLVREAFRLARNDLPPMDLHVVPRQHAKNAKLSDIAAEFKLLYSARPEVACFDKARQSKIDSKEEHHSQIEKGDEEDRFGKAAACQNRSDSAVRSKCQT